MSPVATTPEPVDRLAPAEGGRCDACGSLGVHNCIPCLAAGEVDCESCRGRSVVACLVCGGSLDRAAFRRWCERAMDALMPADVRAAVDGVSRLQTGAEPVEHRNGGGVYRVSTARGRGGSLAGAGFTRLGTRPGSMLDHWFWQAPRDAWWCELARQQLADATPAEASS